MIRLRPSLALAVLLVASAAQAAPSDESRARAAESFRQAQAAFERRDFAAAAAAFESAAGFAPHPAAWLSAADAWQRAGEPARAAEDCDRARAVPDLADASAADHADYAHDAATCLERVRARVALVAVSGAGATAVRVDDGPEQVLPARQWIRPGRHVLTLVDLQSSRTRRLELDVHAGEERTVDATTPAPQAPPAPAPVPASSPANPVEPSAAPRRGRGLPTASWVAFGLAVPAAVAYGVTAVMTLQAQHDFDATPTASTRDAFYRDRTMADVSFAVALTAAAAGVVLWLVAPDEPPPRVGVVRF
ncbi:MAG TPA: hypothetical protein VF765_14070 [Polyangiaceae bacterium]